MFAEARTCIKEKIQKVDICLTKGVFEEVEIFMNTFQILAAPMSMQSSARFLQAEKAPDLNRDFSAGKVTLSR
ncbi:hypothetical protein ACOSP7_023402 [Xanthoceras sorbifolium]